MKVMKRAMVFGLVVSLFLAGAPSGSAQEDATGLVGANTLELFIDGAAIGGPMSPVLPPEGASKTGSVLSTATTPGAGFFVNLGDIKPEADLTFLSDSIASVWLSGNAVRTQISLYIRDGSTVVARGDTPASVVSQVAGVARYDVRMPTLGAKLIEGKTYTFDIVFFGVGAAGPADVLLHWGSATHPSGLSGAVDTGDAYPTVNTMTPFFLGDTALTTTPPGDTTDKARTIPAASSSMATAGAWSWGKVTVDDAMTITGDSILTVWIKMNGNAGTMRGLSAAATFGGTSRSFTYGNFATAFQSTTVNRYTFVFATRGLEIEAGKDISFTITTWTSTETPAGNFQVVYGSVARPAGLYIPTAGGAKAEPVPLLLTAELPEMSAEPGTKASFLLKLTNPGEAAANVTFNSTGDLPAVFPSGSTVSVASNASADVAVEVEVPEGSTAGQQYNVIVHAFADGVEVANITLVAVASASPPPTDSEPGAANTSAATNGEARSLEDDGEGIPGPGLIVVAGVLAWAARRQARRRA